MGEKLDTESMAHLALFLCKDGDAFMAKNDFPQASVRLAQALSVFRELGAGNNEYIAWLLHNLGVITLGEGKQWEAENFLEASAFVQLKLGQAENVADALTELARRMASFNAYGKARWLCAQAHATYKNLGFTGKLAELEKFMQAVDLAKPEAVVYQPREHYFVIMIYEEPIYGLTVSPDGSLAWHILSALSSPAPLDLVSWKVVNKS